MNQTHNQVAIIGAGQAGLSAALFLAETGLSVELIERRDTLGGHGSDWSCMATEGCRYCSACTVAELVEKAKSHPSIHVHTAQHVTRTSKNGNGFELSLNDGKSLQAQAVMLAMGMRPFDPTPLEPLGYGRLEGVTTTVELNRILRENRLNDFLPEGDRAAKVAFIQCVGSRDKENGGAYCSQVCCKVAVRLAHKLSHLRPDAELTVFTIDLQNSGKVFRSFVDEISPRVQFVQGAPAEIRPTAENGLVIIHENPESGGREPLTFDRIVLAVGMTPPAELGDLLNSLGAATDEYGFIDPASLPENVFAIGAATGPTDLINARADALAKAGELAQRLLSNGPVENNKLNLAVIGGGPAAQAVAQAALQRGYQVNLIDEQQRSIEPHEALQYTPSASLVNLTGVLGDFTLTLMTSQGRQRVPAAAIVLATGATRERNLPEGLPTDSTQALFLPELAERMQTDLSALPARIAFWIDREGPEWKAHARQALKLALQLAENGRRISLFSEKMLVHGLYGQALYDKAKQAGVRFLRLKAGSRPRIETDADALHVTLNEATIPGDELQVDCDLLVLAEAVRPNEENQELAILLREDADGEGFMQSPNVRQRPVNGFWRGVAYAGDCHDELEPEELKREALAVISSLDALLRYAKPPELAPVIINEKKCVRCLTCFSVCPHRAIELLKGSQPHILPTACVGCGICAGSCPALAIDHNTSTNEQLAGEGTEPELVLFACERSAALAFEQAQALGLSVSEQRMRLVRVPCAGRVGIESLLDPLIRGAKQVALLGCHEGNCRSKYGSHFGENRIERARIGLGSQSERIRFFPVAANEPESVRDILKSLLPD